MPNLFQQFLNQVNRGYGQLDKRVFGGLLPGGAATPIGEAVQRAKPEFRPSPVTRRVASLADVATTAAAKTQPFVESLVKKSPTSAQNLLSSGLNALPFSVNLFGRYYTGLGNQGLSIPENITAELKPHLKYLEEKKLGKEIESTKQSIQTFEKLLDLSKNPAKNTNGIVAPPEFSKHFNDQLAQYRSDLARMKKGEIPYSGYNTSNENPLSSTSTSLGSVWFKPTGKGYTAKETYDFAYGGADKLTPFGPFLQEIVGIPALSPSQEHLMRIMEGSKMVPGATQSPLTNLGRAIVSKMPNKKFDYTIDVP